MGAPSGVPSAVLTVRIDELGSKTSPSLLPNAPLIASPARLLSATAPIGTASLITGSSLIFRTKPSYAKHTRAATRASSPGAANEDAAGSQKRLTPSKPSSCDTTTHITGAAPVIYNMK